MYTKRGWENVSIVRVRGRVTKKVIEGTSSKGQVGVSRFEVP